MIKLKLCPFCGGKAERSLDELGGSDGEWLFCADCGWGMQIEEVDEIEDVINRWNTRPIEDKQIELIEKLVGALKTNEKSSAYFTLAQSAIEAYDQWKEKSLEN